MEEIASLIVGFIEDIKFVWDDLGHSEHKAQSLCATRYISANATVFRSIAKIVYLGTNESQRRALGFSEHACYEGFDDYILSILGRLDDYYLLGEGLTRDNLESFYRLATGAKLVMNSNTYSHATIIKITDALSLSVPANAIYQDCQYTT